MIKIDVIERCPYTVVGTGVMRVSHNVLGILAGAVYDKNEWIALLVGTRSTDGLDIIVTNLRVPLQTRSHASCELARPEPLADDVVGVIHSHHNMGAFFSQTDHDTLNTRFPSSLVVARVKHTSSDIERLLGFSYKAEGRASLPCGNPGVVNFIVVPDPVISGWVLTPKPGYGEPKIAVGLDECPYVTETVSNLMTNCSTKCGVVTTEPTVAVFGKDDKTFMAEVIAKTETPKYPQFQPGWNRQDRHPNFNGQVNYPGMVVVDNRVPWGRGHGPFEDDDMYDERYLKHWGV